MPRLQALYWLDSGSPSDPVLPRGPWLGSLRRLAVATHMAQRSLAVLSEATQLQALAIKGWSAEAALRVAACAAGMPALRRLAVAFSKYDSGQPDSFVWDTCWRPFKEGLARLRLPPEFQVERGCSSPLFGELAQLSVWRG